jgi:TfoX/Sxy family transcriptional regulator of competence genes
MAQRRDVGATFDRVAARLLEQDESLEQARMMNAFGLKTAGKFFAFVRNGELVVKLPRQRVDELVASGEGRHFDRGQGRPLKEWVALRPANDAACADYVEEARSFVARHSYS